MDWKRVALGIGNPGAEYAATRHNVGFMVLDRVAKELGLAFGRLPRELDSGDKVFPGSQFLRKRLKAQVARGEHFVLVKPLTYVNLSGDVAFPLLRAAGLGPESLFVVVDDLNLPLGRIRIRPAGSPGGHNGLASIAAALHSDAYPRLRLGIGAPVGTTFVDHVLASFLPEEREVLDPALDRAAVAVRDWLQGASVQTLMDRCNGPGP